MNKNLKINMKLKWWCTYILGKKYIAKNKIIKRNKINE